MLLDTDQWPAWSRLVTGVEGVLTPGEVWTIQLRPEETDGLPRRMRPRLLSVTRERRELVFETLIGGAWAVRLTHAFAIEPAGTRRSVLTQSFEATGLFVLPLWRVLHRGMVQFDELGADLAVVLREG